MLNKSAKFAKNTNRFQPSLLQLEQRLTPATFAEPVGLFPQDGILEVTLTAKQGTIQLDTVSSPVSNALTYSYKLDHGISNGASAGAGLYPGPTLHVNPGQTLILHYVNEMSNLTIPDLTDMDGNVLTSANANNHTHGLHISPAGNSDNVLLNIQPGSANTYTYQIPTNQPEGLYWYHNHFHGLTQEETYLGLSGMLVIGQPDGGIPKVSQNQLPSRLIAIQYNDVFGRADGLSTLVSANGQPWNITDGPVGTQYVNVGGASGYVPNNLFSFEGTLNGQPYAIQANTALPESARSTQFTVNGQFQPTLSAPKGQTEIWSIVNNSDLAYARLRLTNTADGSHPQIIVLGQDGIAYDNAALAPLENGTQLLMPPASRYTIAVTVPLTGDLVLEMPPDPNFTSRVEFPGSSVGIVVPATGGQGKQVVTAQGTAYLDPASISYFNGFNYFPSQQLLRVTSTTSVVAPVLFVPGEPLEAQNQFQDLSNIKPDYVRDIVLNEGNLDPDDPSAFVFTINGDAYPYAPTVQPRLNSVEEWVFTNITTDQHPMHVHVNSFQVMEVVDPNNPTNSHGVQNWYQDVVNVPAAKFDTNGNLVAPGIVKIRSQYKDYTGAFVQHCHRLDHEDGGMMQLVDILTEKQFNAAGVSGNSNQDAKVEVRDDTDASFLASLVPFPGYRGQLSVALGDVDGDSIADLAVSPLSGMPHVKVYSGASLNTDTPFARLIASFIAEGFSGGVAVSVGAIDGTPRSNVVLASQGGMNATIGVVALMHEAQSSLLLPMSIASFMPFVNYQGSLSVATGLVDDSGRISIVVGAGYGAPPNVAVFNYSLMASMGNSDMTSMVSATPLGMLTNTASFYAFSQSYLGGISVATGWVNGPQGGFQNILVGALVGSSNVVTFSTGSALNGFPSMSDMDMTTEYYLTSSFYAFGEQSTAGTRVSASDTLRGANLLVSTVEANRGLVSRFDLLRHNDATLLEPKLLETLEFRDSLFVPPSLGGY